MCRGLRRSSIIRFHAPIIKGDHAAAPIDQQAERAEKGRQIDRM